MLNLSLVLLDAKVKEFIDYYDLSGHGVVDLLNLLQRAEAGTLGHTKNLVDKKTARKRKPRRV